MTKLGVSIVVALAAPLFPAGARADNEPLLVVVEAAPGADVAPTDVRQAIASELRAPVVAPRDPAAAGSEKLLVVAVDSAAIRMSLRAGASQPVSRTIPAPPERPARLRAIGWLAGNLARDQVEQILETLPSSAPHPAASAAVQVPAPVADPTQARPEVVPPPFAPPPEPAGAPSTAATVATRAVVPAVDRARWTLTVTGGPALSLAYVDFRTPGEWLRISSDDLGSVYRVSLQRSSSADGLIVGAALEVGSPDGRGNMVGGAGLLAKRWEHRRWFLEAGAGLGLELVPLPVQNRMVISSSTMGIAYEEVTSWEQQPALYAFGSGALGVAVSRLFDVVAGLDLHLSSGGSIADFLAASLGLRMRLP